MIDEPAWYCMMIFLSRRRRAQCKPLSQTVHEGESCIGPVAELLHESTILLKVLSDLFGC
jgi:hypothetical protein